MTGPSPTNRYMNVSSASFTPAGGSLAALDGIKSVQIDDGLEVLEESADYDAYVTTAGVTLSKPRVTLRTIDAFGIATIAGGQTGVLTLTVRDFTNGATTGGGAKVVQLGGSEQGTAYLAQRSRDSEYRQLATQSIAFYGVSPDGATSPLSITAA